MTTKMTSLVAASAEEWEADFNRCSSPLLLVAEEA